MRNKASRPENMKNKYDENMTKSTALPDIKGTFSKPRPGDGNSNDDVVK